MIASQGTMGKCIFQRIGRAVHNICEPACVEFSTDVSYNHKVPINKKMDVVTVVAAVEFTYSKINYLPISPLSAEASIHKIFVLV